MNASDTQLQLLIDRARQDDIAWNELFDHACDRLLRLTRKMFHSQRDLKRWEQTDDVFQQAMLRLHRALDEVKPESVRHFFNLAGVMIRRTLIDLAKHHLGPQGLGANHHTDGIGVIQQAVDGTGEPTDLDGWTDFHSQVGLLPNEEQEVVNLLFYEGLTQAEAAEVLCISLRTLKRRWQSARCQLHNALRSEETG